MKFEKLLAKRYIFSQKRHSMLTICSITIAAAFMAMIFTCFNTAVKCARAVTYDKNPYHVMIYEITTDQAEQLYSDPMIESIKLKPIPHDIQNRSSARIMLKKGIGDINVYLDNIFEKYSLGFNITDDNKFEVNRSLLDYDQIDDSARFTLLSIFCILYIMVIFIAASLRMIIDTAFEVSSKEKERQFGILQSVGASPKQIVRIITWEAVLLCIVAVPLGMISGIGLAYIAFKKVTASGLIQTLISAKKTAELIRFHVSPLMLAVAAITSVAWVLLSAYGVGMRIIKISPIQAISNRSNKIFKIRKHSVLGAVFGWSGKLASRNVRRQKKRFIITVISLVFSITLFSSTAIIVDTINQTTKDSFKTPGFFGQEELQDFEIVMEEVTSDENGSNIDDPLLLSKICKDMENSGYFKNINYDYWETGVSKNGNPKEKTDLYQIMYISRPEYDKYLKDKTGISYDKLTQEGYIMINRSYNESESNNDIISLDINFKHQITNEEYEEMTKEERKAVQKTNSKKYLTEKNTIDFNVLAEYPVEEIINPQLLKDGEILNELSNMLISTVDRYNTKDYSYYTDFTLYRQTFYCDIINEEDSAEALHYIDNNENIKMLDNWLNIKASMDLTLITVKTALSFIILVIALIASINMINIITTGLINRKKEIACAQCIGMTEDQLYKESFIECLQYVIPSGIVSIILSCILLYATKAFTKAVQLDINEIVSSESLNYFTPISKILIASLAALIISVAATFITLKNMQKENLIERIKNVE